MKTTLFITGTDTGVGKTYVATHLLNEARKAGLKTLGIKPVASGCHLINGKWVNEDATALQLASSIQLPYDKINPYAFIPPIAPHIAAEAAGISLSVQTIIDSIQDALNQPYDLCIIEGAGGWYVPLNKNETLADVATTLGLPVILVVDIKLGCINHSLLTQRAMHEDSANVLGWIANRTTTDLSHQFEVISTLEKSLRFPLLSIY